MFRKKDFIDLRKVRRRKCRNIGKRHKTRRKIQGKNAALFSRGHKIQEKQLTLSVK